MTRLGKTSYGHVAFVGRQPGQCRCVWCNNQFYSDRPCLTDEQKQFVLTYAKAAGRLWKSKLESEWRCNHGPAVSIELREQRGVNWLTDLSLAKLERVLEFSKRRERSQNKKGKR